MGVGIIIHKYLYNFGTTVQHGVVQRAMFIITCQIHTDQMRAHRQDRLHLFHFTFRSGFAKIGHPVFFDKGIVVGWRFFVQGIFNHVQHPFFELLSRFVQTHVHSSHRDLQKIGDLLLG